MVTMFMLTVPLGQVTFPVTTGRVLFRHTALMGNGLILTIVLSLDCDDGDTRLGNTLCGLNNEGFFIQDCVTGAGRHRYRTGNE